MERACVCICTYRRPGLLRRALESVAKQNVGEWLDYSIVVADNDAGGSGREVVAAFSASSRIKVAYCIEPEQNIALARNKALEHAAGDYVAFIDDDEFADADWLVTLWKVLTKHGADGVLGPVRPVFDHEPPDWLVKGRFCERAEHATGVVLDWQQTRTGNVMFRRELVNGLATPFRAEFGNGGEDQDFFRRMMVRGNRFVWCNEAIVYEVVPPERCERRYLLKRALLRGQNEERLLSYRSIMKSLVAVPIYAASLLVVWVPGEHVFMKCMIRLCDHLGKVLVAVGIRLITGKYLTS